MDPQKFGDSYDLVKSVPRQLFLPRIASNQMLLNFGRTRSLGRSSHEIGDRLAIVVGRSRRNSSTNPIWGIYPSGSSALLMPSVIRARIIT